MRLLKIINHLLGDSLCGRHILLIGQGRQTGIIPATEFADEGLYGFFTVRMVLLSIFVCLLRIPFSHDPVTLKTMFGHHVIGQFDAILIRRGKFCHLIKQRLEYQMGKRIRFGLIHARKSVFAQIGIFIAGYILDMAFYTLTSENGIHCLFQSEHTVLQSFLRLIHSTPYSFLIALSGQCPLVTFGRSIPEQLIGSRRPVILNMRILSDTKFVLFGHIRSFAEQIVVLVLFQILITSPQHITEFIIGKGYSAYV